MADTIVTYVILYPGTNLVKIGQAKYFVDRFAQLKTASPVDPEVLCVFLGSAHERHFHERFRHLRHHGEFYHYTAELKEYVFSTNLAKHRLTKTEAEALSPRIERNARPDAGDGKVVEMEASLETDD